MRVSFFRKQNIRKGFTLAETLLAVLIMLMVSVIVATGIPVARNAYNKVVRASNAEVLLSTTISSLRNELGTAKDIERVASGPEAGVSKAIVYYNPTRGASSRIYLDTANPKNGIMFQRYYSADGLLAAYTPVRLISEKTSTEDLYVTYSDVSYDREKGLIQFTGLSVNRGSGDTGLASRDTLSIRVLADPAGE